MSLLTNLRGAATRARVFIMGLACELHWRTFGPRTSLLIEVDDTEGVNCNVNCEAVGGPDHCMCVVAAAEGYAIEYVDPDVETNYTEIDPENGMRYRVVAVNPHLRDKFTREYAEIVF